MSECVILIASAKVPIGKRCDFSWSYIRLSATPHHFSPTDNKSTAKEQKLTKECLCLSLIGFLHKVHNIKLKKQISIPF